jgi:NAD(P)-dependent dehydrogenase (short-subunit alcohol dehydrogenase family)
MADINEVLLDETLGTLEKKHPGSKETSVVCDVTKTDDCRKAVEKTIEAFGRLDVLINSAGVIKKGPVEEVPEADFKETLADFPQGDAARFIYPEDVANLLAFLASDRAEAMTGAPVHLDFGTTAGN